MTDAAWRAGIVDYAKKYVGVKEEPPGSNTGPRTPPFAHVIEKWQKWCNGMTGYPWCSAFVCGMIREGGNRIVPEPRAAGVGFFEEWAIEHGALVKRPLKGDVVTYRFDSDNWPDHIGLIDRVIAVRWIGGKFAGTIRTIEGNTSAGNNANGGQVQIRYRSAYRCKFLRLTPDELEKARTP
jgi:hypothetical protein